MSRAMHYLVIGTVAFLGLCFPACKAADEKPKETTPVAASTAAAPDVDVNAVSETLGHLIVRHLSNPGFEFKIDKIVQGMLDEKAGKPAPMSEEDYEQSIARVQESLFKALADQNLAAANAFLEANGKKEGIVSINPQLQYEICAAGEGDEVTGESTPLIHYTGKLADGTIFASSRETDKPIALPIKQTIPGFSSGLLGMKKGEKRVLYIHPELAYGMAGHLPPNSLLIFEVEVLETDTTKAEEKPAEPTPA